MPETLRFRASATSPDGAIVDVTDTVTWQVSAGLGTFDGSTLRVPGTRTGEGLVSARLSELDARYVLETDGGDLIYVQNRAIRSGPPELIARLVRGEAVDPAQIYFRCSPSFETASASLAWMAERMFVGTGARYPDAVAMRFFELC